MIKQSGLVGGSAIFFLSSLIAFVARFATSVIVARTLGVEGKGIYALTILVVSMLALFLDPGLTSAITYLVASQQYKPGELFLFSMWTSIIMSSLGGGIFLILYATFLSNTFLAGIQPQYISLILFLLPVNLLTNYLSGMLLGLQEIIRFNLVSILRVIAALVLQIISAIMDGGVLGAILAYVAASVLTLFFVLWLQRRSIRFNVSGQKLIFKKAFSYGIKSYIANLTSFFNYRLDTFIVNFFHGTANVGLYSTGVATAEILWYVPNAVSSALFPKSASLDKTIASKVTARACRQTLLLIVPLTIIFGFMGTFIIPLFFGRAFQASVLPFLLLLPGIVGVTISKIVFANLSGSGKPQYATYTSLLVLIFTVIFDVIMIPSLGIVGAAIASSLSYILVASFSIYWFYKETSTRWFEVILPTMDDVHYLSHLGRESAIKSYTNIKQIIHSSRIR